MYYKELRVRLQKKGFQIREKNILYFPIRIVGDQSNISEKYGWTFFVTPYNNNFIVRKGLQLDL